MSVHRVKGRLDALPFDVRARGILGIASSVWRLVDERRELLGAFGGAGDGVAGQAYATARPRFALGQGLEPGRRVVVRGEVGW